MCARAFALKVAHAPIERRTRAQHVAKAAAGVGVRESEGGDGRWVEMEMECGYVCGGEGSVDMM